MADCPVCAGMRVVEAARVFTDPRATYVAWSDSTVLDCPKCIAGDKK
jgi:hypothetical protein